MLKVGDIKGVEIRGRKVACVVVGHRHSSLTVITIQGQTEIVNENTPYSIVRLSPEVRGTFERMAKEAKKMERHKQAIRQQQQEIYAIEAKLEEEKLVIQEQSGRLSQRQFLEVMYGGLSGGAKASLREYMRLGRVQESPEGIKISIMRMDLLAKYVNPLDFDFLYTEYDGTIHLSTTESEGYKRIVARESRKDVEIAPVRGIKIKQNRHFGIGDKNTLTYHHEQVIEVKTRDGMTRELAEKLSKLITVK